MERFLRPATGFPIGRTWQQPALVRVFGILFLAEAVLVALNAFASHWTWNLALERNVPTFYHSAILRAVALTLWCVGGLGTLWRRRAALPVHRAPLWLATGALVPVLFRRRGGGDSRTGQPEAVAIPGALGPGGTHLGSRLRPAFRANRPAVSNLDARASAPPCGVPVAGTGGSGPVRDGGGTGVDATHLSTLYAALVHPGGHRGGKPGDVGVNPIPPGLRPLSAPHHGPGPAKSNFQGELNKDQFLSLCEEERLEVISKSPGARFAVLRQAQDERERGLPPFMVSLSNHILKQLLEWGSIRIHRFHVEVVPGPSNYLTTLECGRKS